MSKFKLDEVGNVISETETFSAIVGRLEKVETIRLDANNVQDISSTFDLVKGEYVERSRTTRPIDISIIKQNKIAELTASRDAQMFAGFSSNATGTVVDFGFDAIDQAYLQEKGLLMTIDTTVNSLDWKTKQGFITLTRDQFFQVVKDAGAFKESLIRELMHLEGLVLNASTTDEVNVITW